MAPVNPQVPQVSDPFYLHLSRPAQEPTPDKSGGTLFKTIGGAIEDTGKTVDTGIKKSIQNDITKQMTSIDEENISGLESTKAAIEGGTQTTQNIQGNQPNDVLTAQGSAAVPSDIHQGINAVQMFQDVRNNGKITESDKLGRQYKVLKDIRQQWPQYRDYIDKESERITGKNVANAYANSLIGDLNAVDAGKNKERDSIAGSFKELRDKGVEGAAIYENQWHAGLKSNDDARLFINKSNAFKYNYEVRKQGYEINEQDLKTDQQNSIPLTTDLLAAIQHTYSASLFEGKDGVAKLEKTLASGAKPDPNDVLTANRQIQQAKVAFETEARAKLNDTRLGIRGRSLSSLSTAEEMERRIKSQSAWFDERSAMLTGGNYSAVHALDNEKQAMQDINTLAILKHPVMGKFAQLDSALGKIGGPVIQKAMSDYFLNLQLGGPPGAKSLVQNLVEEMMTQPASRTMAENVKDIRAETGFNETVKAKSIDELIKTVERIKDPNLTSAVKAQIIGNAYDPRNAELVDEFEKSNNSDLSVFGRMFSPDILKEVWRQGGGTTNSRTWQWTRDSATQTFGRLFQSDLRGLGNLSETKGIIGWDNENHKLIPDETMKKNPYVTRLVDRINYGLNNIRSVAETEGTDVNNYLVGELNKYKALNSDNMKGLPQQIYDAVRLQRENQKKSEEEFKTKYKKRSSNTGRAGEE